MAHEVKRLEVMIEKLQDGNFLIREITTLIDGSKVEVSWSMSNLQDTQKHLELVFRY